MNEQWYLPGFEPPGFTVKEVLQTVDPTLVEIVRSYDQEKIISIVTHVGIDLSNWRQWESGIEGSQKPKKLSLHSTLSNLFSRDRSMINRTYKAYLLLSVTTQIAPYVPNKNNWFNL